MEKEYVVLKGQVFEVAILSHLGSTNYGWCIASLPKEVVFMASENIFVGGDRNTTLQKFLFGVVAAEEKDVEIVFNMNCWSDLSKVADNYTAKVKIVSSDSAEFVSYSEKQTNVNIPYGFVSPEYSTLKYGYPCGVQDANLKYGYPCDAMKDARPYGYPCGVQDTAFKYGYPCGLQDASMKYGYPCETTKDARPYGYPYWQ